jgi:GT2 family glycosyltransferase
MTSSIAIVNWNSGDFLRICIQSLLATAPASEIIVVDNASTDTSLDALTAFRDRIDIVRNSVNRGFAAAVNQAVAETAAPYVLILNPDVRVMPNAVALLEEFLDTHPKTGAVGGHVNEKYLPRPLPTVASLVRENFGMVRRPATKPSSDPVPVEQPAAAALMVRREAFDEIGGFDARFYPAWYEDVDFCWRLKAAGWEIYFAPTAEFRHEGGYSAAALGATAFAEAYYHNQLRFVQKHFSGLGTLLVRASMVAGMAVRMALRPARADAYGRVFLGALLRW